MHRPLLALWAFSLAFLTGCGQTEVDSASPPVINGYNHFEGQTSSGAQYAIDVADDFTDVEIDSSETSITLESIRGAIRPDDVQQNHPETGQYELDFRVVDHNGVPFVQGFGGDDYADPIWREEFEATSNIVVSDDDRQMSYALLEDADEALDSVGLTLDHVANMKQAVKAEIIDHDTVTEALAEIRASQDDGNPPPPPGATTYTHVIRVYSHPLWYYWGGDHSSTLAYSYNSSTTAVAYMEYHCNHGACYYDSSMSLKCSGTFTGRSNAALANSSSYAPYSSGDTSYGPSGGGCGTSYSILPGYHVCNDDSAAQYGNIYMNTTGLTWATCADTSLNLHAPTCY